MNKEQDRTKELEKEIKQLKKKIGEKTMEIEAIEILIKIANKDLGINIKKQFGENQRKK